MKKRIQQLWGQERSKPGNYTGVGAAQNRFGWRGKTCTELKDNEGKAMEKRKWKKDLYPEGRV